MEKNDVLELKSRCNIYNYILRYPGLHIRELSRLLDMPKSTLIYHLRYLKKNGFIEENFDEFYTRYYAIGTIDRSHKKILALLRQKTSRRVILYLFLNPLSSMDAISKNLNKTRKAISYHLKKLINFGIIECHKIDGEKKYLVFEGNGRLLFIAINYEKNFFDEETEFAIKKAEQRMKGQGMDKAIEFFYDVFPHPYHV